MNWKFLKKWKNIFAVMMLVIVAVSYFLWDFKNYADEQVEKEILSYMDDIRKQSAFMLEINMRDLIRVLETEARLFNEKGEMSEEEIMEELVNFNKTPDITRATIVTPNGEVYSSEFGVQKINVGIEEIGRAFERTESWINNKPRVYEPTGNQLIDISTPLYINDERFGNLTISYDKVNLQRIFAVAFLNGNCAIELMTGDGTIISRIDKSTASTEYAGNDNVFEFYDRKDVKLLDSSVTLLKEKMKNRGEGHLKYEYKGEVSSVSYAPAGVNDWYLATIVADTTIKANSSNFNKMAGMLAVKIALLMMFVTAVFICHIAKEEKVLNELKMESLERAASLDGLSKLYNKSTAREQIEEFLKNSEGDRRHALFMIDIDLFKNINDKFGHVVGDEVIAQFGRLLSETFRGSDILGRNGGDEFIVFLKDYVDINVVAAKAEEINDKLRKMYFANVEYKETPKISVSIGIALYSEHGEIFEELYKKADKALYDSKESGRGKFTFFNNNNQ